jgi:hypothetical protein
MEHSIGEARARLRDARAMLAEPWTRGPDSFQTCLAQAIGCLQKAVQEGRVWNRSEMEAGVQQLQRELGDVATLVEAASRLTSGWLQIADLFVGVYGCDAEAIPVASAPRLSVQV